MKTLVLGLGNELLSDDGVGIAAARSLRTGLAGHGDVDVVESSLAGLALLDLFLGYDRAIVIDAIRTRRAPPGSILELSPADLHPVAAPSPHFTGLPEMLAVARELDLRFPEDIRILAVEAEDLGTIGGGMTAAVRLAIPEVEARVLAWLGTGDPARAPAEPRRERRARGEPHGTEVYPRAHQPCRLYNPRSGGDGLSRA
jgi:hydrogenase maturation protease